MKITIPQHSVLGVYIGNNVMGVIGEPTIEKIMTAVSEELSADNVTTVKPFADIAFEWGHSHSFAVRVDDGEDDIENQFVETITLMPIVIY